MKQLTEQEKKAQEIFTRLYRRALTEGYLIGCPSVERIKHLLKVGEPLPDKYLPGRLVEKLSDEDREALKHLTSELIQDRWLQDKGIR